MRNPFSFQVEWLSVVQKASCYVCIFGILHNLDVFVHYFTHQFILNLEFILLLNIP